MKTSVYGQKTSSKQQGSDKFYVPTINIAELKKVFGEDGQYGSLHAVLFDGTTKKFYYLNSFSSTNHAVNPSMWLPVPPADMQANEWVASTYLKGSLVMKTLLSNEVEFYFAVANAIGTDVPGASAKWFKIPIDNAAISAPRQVVYHTISPSANPGHLSRQFEINVNDDISFFGTRLPIVQCMILNSTGYYEIAHPDIRCTLSPAKVLVHFYGDLSQLSNTSNNIVITLM